MPVAISLSPIGHPKLKNLLSHQTKKSSKSSQVWSWILGDVSDFCLKNTFQLSFHSNLCWVFKFQFLHMFTAVRVIQCTIYLQTTSYMQCHLFDVGGRKSFVAVLSPLLDQVVKGLLSSVLHSQTLGAIFGRSERTEPFMLGQGHTGLTTGVWCRRRILIEQNKNYVKSATTSRLVTPVVDWCAW